MKKAATLTLVLALLFSAVAGTQIVKKARAETITVPDDYAKLQDAINAANEGDTIFVKKGTYEEQTLQITKTLSLIGEDTNNTVIKLHPPVYNVTQILTQFYAALSNAITINADDFRLLNLTVSLNPDGYIVVTGNRTQIISNNIMGGSMTGLIISGSHCNITDNTSGGFISTNGNANLIARNSAYSILTDGESNIIGNNTVWYLKLSNTNNSIFFENQIGSPFRYYNELHELARENSGIVIDGNSFNNTFFANDVAAYSYDVEMEETNSKSENNTFYHNNFLNNSRYTGIGMRTANFVNFWDNGKEGNYWEDYNGTDANGDGIGDAPYVIDADNVDRYPLMFPYEVENDTVVLPPPELFPTALVIALVVIITVEGIGLLIYFKKRKR